MIYEQVIYNVFLIFMCLLVVDTIVVGILKRMIIYMATIFDKIKMKHMNFSNSTFSAAKMKIKG